jgi:flagellar biosynthesis/type III secretory pathway M-ring protein FliF/YscJ
MITLFAEAPALPLHTAGPYVAAAYIVFLLVVLIYVWIMARKLFRNNRELQELRAQLEQRRPTEAGPAGPAPIPERAEDPLEPAAHE